MYVLRNVLQKMADSKELARGIGHFKIATFSRLTRSNYIGFTYRIPISLLYSFTVYNWRKKNSSEKEKAGKSD
jgi:hypothetical protein